MQSTESNKIGGPFITFLNGNKFPQIGLGTFLSSEADVRPVVKSAILDHGYRALDTARIYGNEESIGEALQECFAQGIRREELYITTKLWQSDKDNVEGAVRESLRKLKLEYLDLYLIHWMIPKMVWDDKDPVKATPTHKVWAEMERMVDLGLIKNIGVSNCTIPMLLDIWTYARHKPVLNQVEVHPYFPQQELIAFHEKLGCKIEAYAPLGANQWPGRAENQKKLNLFEEPVIVQLAEKYGKKPSQIILNWHLHRGHVIIPKTTKVERLQENFLVFDFQMTEDEYKQITNLDTGVRFFDPKSLEAYEWNYTPYFQ